MTIPSTAPRTSDDSTAANRRDLPRPTLGASATPTGAPAAIAGTLGDPLESAELLALDQMATKPTTLAMSPRATSAARPTRSRSVSSASSPTRFDPQGTERSEGPDTS